MVSQDARNRARINAEAAAWLARLHGSNRTDETAAAVQEWLKADHAHEAAFERATELWELLPGAALVRQTGEDMPVPVRRRAPALALAAGIVALIGAVGGSYAWLDRAPTYVTDVGQQQTTSLSDGTRVSLNTDSKITILYSENERRVRLDRGEAMFDVSHNAQRPFIVMADNEEVRALGTSFVVRRQDDRLAVTLLKGRVAVSKEGRTKRVQLAVLTPGERLTVRETAPVAIDRPQVEAVTAWRRGEVMFDETRLADAATELNRYGSDPIRIGDPSVANLRVSGVFETNDAAEFASAVAQLNGLKVVRTGDALILAR